MSYFHLRMFWGAFDTTYITPAYSGAALVSGGPDAQAGSGVGVRRAELVYNRVPPGTFADDVAVMHFDFINFTGGTPDDTWTTGDFTTMEGHLTSWWNAQKPYISSDYTLKEIRWYRVGTGVPPPNPAQRVTAIGTAGSSGGVELPPQVAVSLTLKTSARKQWGRTYVPGCVVGDVAAHGLIDSTVQTTFATNLDDLVTSSAADDFAMGVLSKVAGSFFLVEQIQVDNLFDVIRRRRWRNPTSRITHP